MTTLRMGRTPSWKIGWLARWCSSQSRDATYATNYVHRSAIMAMKLSIAFCTVVALCLQLLQPHCTAGGEEGSSESQQQSANVLLLRSGCEETARWFNISSDDALLAARLACADIAQAAAPGDPLRAISVEIMVNCVKQCTWEIKRKCIK